MPTAATTNSIEVEVRDDNGVTTNKTFTLTITNSFVTIVTPSPLPDGTVGVGYSHPLEATGGTGNYAWTIAGLPDGLLPDSSGDITGIPTTAGIFNFVAQVTDMVTGASASNLFSLTISNVLGTCTWTITTSVKPSGSGNGGSPLVLAVNCGESVTVTARPRTCYYFVNWTAGASSAPRQVTPSPRRRIGTWWPISRKTSTQSARAIHPPLAAPPAAAEQMQGAGAE